MSDKVYFDEFIDIIKQNRANYMHLWPRATRRSRSVNETSSAAANGER